MRYRRSSVRYTTVVGGGQAWIVGDVWSGERPRLLLRAGFRPDLDAYETATTFEIVLDLAGMDEEDCEIQLFANALVVEGHRRLPEVKEAAIYHAASIRQGPFRVEIPLPAPIDPERVEASYERGLLRITLTKVGAR
jgi:HSP20 family protein